MTRDLAAYLAFEASRRYALGSADCITLVAGWVMRCRGVDPMAAQRGYADAAEAAALVSGWGGIARIMGRSLRASGLRMTRDPQPADVALVVLRDGRAVGAIRSQRGWAMRLDSGLATLPPAAVRVIAAWSL